MSTTLPLDLLRPIIAHGLSPTDLCSIALVCRTFRDEAQRMLFANPTVKHTATGSDAPALPSPFLDAIISSPDRLGSLVRELNLQFHYLPITNHSGSWRTVPAVNKAAFVMAVNAIRRKIKHALRHMHNLTRLRLYTSYSADYRPEWHESLLEGCPFQLQDLIIIVSGLRITPFIERSLATQTKLRALTWEDTTDIIFWEDIEAQTPSISIPNTYCPSLQKVTAPWSLVRFLLESRRGVTSVEVTGCHTLDSPLPDAAREQLRRVHHLRIQTRLLEMEFSISDLRNIVFLQVGCVYEEMNTHLQELPSIVQLPRLEVFIVDDHDLGDIEEWTTFLFAKSSSLRQVYLCDGPRILQHQSWFTRFSYNNHTGEIIIDRVNDQEMKVWHEEASLAFPDAL